LRRSGASSPAKRVVYYSPTGAFRGRDGLQSFTALGVVDDGAPYQAEMGGGFSPFRRDVTWCRAQETPIRPLVGRLHFTTARPNWGFQLRFGLFEISEQDMAVIATAMGAAA
jgi:EVE domain